MTDSAVMTKDRDLDRILRNQYYLAVALQNIALSLQGGDGRKSDRDAAINACMTLVRETEAFANESQKATSARHERRVVGHASGWQEQTDTCVCGRPWPCPLLQTTPE